MHHGRRVLRWQADRFGYWQDGIGWKEFSPFPGFSYRSTVNGAAEDREELEDGTEEGAVATEDFFTGLKKR
ncbi:unnamed protein product [Staurois parvus]|uniref:Uncharacterized protein n=1 Tax=Staurois parvus TaxID=386267 RepID=A0ABN9FLB1_9NEOB|nr:unnamed protein product [Staurois parvus]